VSDWVKFHVELCRGAKRGIPRAYRFIYLELAREARKLRGIVELPSGMSDVDGVYDLLGGNREEVEGALSALTIGRDAMLTFEGKSGARRLIVKQWKKWNSFEPPGASTERSRRHRAAAQQGTLPGFPETNATDSQRPLQPVANGKQRSAFSRVEKRRSDHQPGSITTQYQPEAGPAAGGVGDIGALRNAIREALASSRGLEAYAHEDGVEALATSAFAAGRHPDHVALAIRNLATKVALGGWARSRIEGALTAAVQYAKAPPTDPREGAAKPRGRRRNEREVQGDPGWEDQEKRDREAFEAEQAKHRAAPDYEAPRF
jgi:hypothetical protein